MKLMLTREKLVLTVVGCFIAIVVIFYLQTVQNSSSLQIISENDRRQVHIEQSKNIETMTVSDVSELLVRRLKEPTDQQLYVYNTSCDDISSVAACYDKTCPQTISLDPGTRIADLFKSGKLTLSPAQRDLILSMSKTIPESDVIIASASSSNHYHEMQAMFQSLHQVVYPRLTNFSVVLFDIGLSPEERKMATISKARKYLVWQDSSVRWAENFRTIFDRTYVYGHQILRYKDSSRVPAHTVKQTFDYMEDQPCTFFTYPEIQGNCMLHKHDPLVVKAVLEPWARCALEKECICPVEPNSVLACRQDVKIHRCHRFDQSIITIIMAKVYGDEIYRYISPEMSFDKPQYIFVKRGHAVSDYFKN